MEWIPSKRPIISKNPPQRSPANSSDTDQPAPSPENSVSQTVQLAESQLCNPVTRSHQNSVPRSDRQGVVPNRPPSSRRPGTIDRFASSVLPFPTPMFSRTRPSAACKEVPSPGPWNPPQSVRVDQGKIALRNRNSHFPSPVRCWNRGRLVRFQPSNAETQRAKIVNHSHGIP